LPDSFYPLTRKYGLFSVPAPSRHPCGVRRGFLLGDTQRADSALQFGLVA
jgi:hypothetical protein